MEVVQSFPKLLATGIAIAIQVECPCIETRYFSKTL